MAEQLYTATQERFRLRDEARFQVDGLMAYDLLLYLTDRSLEMGVINAGEPRLLCAESFDLGEVHSPAQRLSALEKLFEEHDLLKAGFWKSVRLALQSPQFAYVPLSLYQASEHERYLRVTSPLEPGRSEFLAYTHSDIEAVGVFAVQKELVSWLGLAYPTQQVSVVHHSSALLEALAREQAAGDYPLVSAWLRDGTLTLIVREGRKLRFVNVFDYESADDLVYYLLFVIEELGLSPETAPLTLWGEIDAESEVFEKLYRYIRHLSIGGYPKGWQFSYEFDAVPESEYFGLLSLAAI